MQKNSAKRPVQKYRVNIGVEIENYQWKVLLLNIPTYIDSGNNEEKPELHSYISNENEQDAYDFICSYGSYIE